MPMIILLYCGAFVCSFFNILASQKYARSTKTANDFFVYALVTGTTAMGVFYITSGFNITLNLRTCIYGLVFALVIFISYFFSLAVFQHMGVAEKSFIGSGLSILMTVTVGCLLYSEKITVATGVQLVLVLLTQLVIFLGKKSANNSTKTVTALGVMICVILSALGTVTTAISKSFAMDKEVTDSSSFFFITNLFIVALSLVGILVINKASVKVIKQGFKGVSLVGYLMIFINVAASNFGSILQVEILRISDLVTYTPLSSALGLLASELVAVFVAKERPRVVATVLAISSVLVVLLF